MAALPMRAGNNFYVAPNGNDMNPGTQAKPFLTIARGIAVAANGDTVLLADGVYSGVGNIRLSFNGKAISVKSSSGTVAQCIIDCQHMDRAFIFENNEGANSQIETITVRNGETVDNPGGAIRIIGASPTILNCVFQDNLARGFAQNAVVNGNGGFAGDGVGGAIAVTKGGSPTLSGCVFFGNVVTGGTTNGAAANAQGGKGGQAGRAFGGAIAVVNSGGKLDNCRFVENFAFGGSANGGNGTPGGDAGSGVVMIAGQRVRLGGGASFGGAIFLGNSTVPLTGYTLIRNIAFGGSATGGNGAMAGNGGDGGFTGAGHGGAVAAYNSMVDIQQSTFTDDMTYGGSGDGGTANGGKGRVIQFSWRATEVAATRTESPPARTPFESAKADFVHLWLRFQPPGEN